MQRCSISLIIRQMKIKTTVRCYFSYIMWAKVQKLYSTICWNAMEKLPCSYIWCWECKVVQLMRRGVLQYWIELQTHSLFDPKILLLGVYFGYRDTNRERFMIFNHITCQGHSAVICNSKRLKTIQMPNKSLVG